MRSILSGDEAMRQLATVGRSPVQKVDHFQVCTTPKRSGVRRWSGSTYRALKKNTSHVNMGRKGRKNCLVTGISKASMSKADAPVFINGPGA